MPACTSMDLTVVLSVSIEPAHPCCPMMSVQASTIRYTWLVLRQLAFLPIGSTTTAARRNELLTRWTMDPAIRPKVTIRPGPRLSYRSAHPAMFRGLSVCVITPSATASHVFTVGTQAQQACGMVISSSSQGLVNGCIFPA